MTQEWSEKWRNCVWAFGSIVLGGPHVCFGNVCFYECGVKYYDWQYLFFFFGGGGGGCCCSVIKSCLTLCDPMDCSTAGFLSFTVSRSLLRFLSIGSVIASNHLTLCCLLLPLPSVFPASGVLQWVVSWHQAAKVLELQLQHQSFQWIFRVDFL